MAPKPIIHDAPEGVESSATFIDGTLYIFVDPTLDEVARQRFIREAKAKAGIREHRRRAIPFMVTGVQGAHRAVSEHTAGTALTVGLVVVGGVAAAAVLSLPPGGHSHSTTRKPPSYAAPAPTRPAPPRRSASHQPTAPSPKPSKPIPHTPWTSPVSMVPAQPAHLPRLHVPSVPPQPRLTVPPVVHDPMPHPPPKPPAGGGEPLPLPHPRPTLLLDLGSLLDIRVGSR